MRRFICCLLCVCFFSGNFCISSLANEPVFEQESTEVAIEGVQAGVLIEATSHTNLYSCEADTPAQVAGLVKLPAILVVCEAIDSGRLTLDTKIKVSAAAASVAGPSAFIEAGEEIEASYLIKSAVMICAGDAVMALGEHIFGTQSSFCEQVKNRLAQLNIKDYIYDDALGDGAVLSPRSLAVLGSALMQSESFKNHAKLTYEEFTHQDGRQTQLVNANQMLKDYAGCTGVATGSSPSQGYSGVFFVTRGETQLVAVVVGAKNSKDRFSAAKSLFEQGFTNKRSETLCQKGEIIEQSVKVKGGKVKQTSLIAKETVVLLLEKETPALIEKKEIPQSLKAPIAAGETVGSIIYSTPEGVEMGRVELVCESEIEALLYRECISASILAFLRA